MTKLDDAIYNLLKNYYEIMDFFNNRDEAFFFIFLFFIKKFKVQKRKEKKKKE